jgi:hypothetical protein
VLVIREKEIRIFLRMALSVMKWSSSSCDPLVHVILLFIWSTISCDPLVFVILWFMW